MPSYETWCDYHGDKICAHCGSPSVAYYCTDCWKYDINPGGATSPPTTKESANLLTTRRGVR
jgi:hypothetical protein